MSEPPRIIANKARYIKLGRGGSWQSLCQQDGTLRLGYYEAPHKAAQAGDKDALRKVYLKEGKAAAASSHARQILEFYDPDPETVWITFSDGYLWWCLAESTVEFLGSDRTQHPNGSRLRRAKGGWRNHSNPWRNAPNWLYNPPWESVNAVRR